MRIAILKTQGASHSPNMGYRVRYAHPNFCFAETIHIPNIKLNSDGGFPAGFNSVKVGRN